MDDQLDAAHSYPLARPSGSREVASQVLSNVQIGTGDVNVVGRDLVQIHNHHVHHYHYAVESPAIPPILGKVPNLRDIHIETLGKATEGTGDWIYVWNEFTIWLASDGYIRILWGSGMRELSLSSFSLGLIIIVARCSGRWKVGISIPCHQSS
ncbi:hypothetical protein BKA70DRAFT_56356 [Coprinopsis sp. MPI-PUGE-AT-0042]|nr:hypothetical protein BKA70DRAFT_56356 [Coprinopsis sp. MPI-PUGE-AT-0042]